MVRYCHYCHFRLRHPYFTYILTDKRCNFNKSSQKIFAKIGISRHPILRLNCHNRKPGYRGGPSTKSTKAGAGFYQLEFIIGPFYNGESLPFFKRWNKARKVTPRLLAGIKLAARFGRIISARDPEWMKRFARKYLVV